MSQDHHAHAGDHAGGHGADHHPHVLPLTHYFGVFGALLVFTVLTVAVSYVDLGQANLFIAMLVATCKAVMVAAIFMHLAYDKKFNTVIIGSSVLFLAIFIIFTMFDTENRGLTDRLGDRGHGDRPADITQPFAGKVYDNEIKERFAAPAAADHKPAGESAH